MLLRRGTTAATTATVVLLLLTVGGFGGGFFGSGESKPRRILLDTDVDVDDFFALLYLLKLNRSEFKLEVRTCNKCAFVHVPVSSLYRDDSSVYHFTSNSCCICFYWTC